MLRSLPLPENRCRLEREVLPEEVSPCVQAQVAEAALPLAVPEAEAVLFQEVPAAVAVVVLFQEVPVVTEAVLLREFTVERRVTCLLPKQRK